MKRHFVYIKTWCHILHNCCCFDSFGFQTLQQMFLQVLYHMFEGFIEIGESNIQSIDIVTGLGSFFIIAIGGTLIGILFGFFGGFITKYTEHVKVIEPLFVFVIGYLMYLTAEMCHLSSILAYVLKKIITEYSFPQSQFQHCYYNPKIWYWHSFCRNLSLRALQMTNQRWKKDVFVMKQQDLGRSC